MSPSLSVAPMEGITNFPMRLWLHLASQPREMTTPFLRVTAVFPERELPAAFIPELTVLRGVLPYHLTPQLISGDPEHFLRVSDLLPPQLSPTIEINCGCPSPNSLGKYAGSGMLQDPEFLHTRVSRLSSHLGSGRLAVKMRLGLKEDEEFPPLLGALIGLPLAKITVHARTRADGYRGHSRWPLVQHTAVTSPHPTWASGDVIDRASYDRLIEVAPAICGVMIGRGILRNPWVFTELREAKQVALSRPALVNALLCYALLQEAWTSIPDKLLSRLQNGRVGALCGLDFGQWETLTALLTGLVLGVPFVLTGPDSARSVQLSGTAFSRLRYLWTFMSASLPTEYQTSATTKAKTAEAFFRALITAGLHAPSGDLHLVAGAQFNQ